MQHGQSQLSFLWLYPGTWLLPALSCQGTGVRGPAQTARLLWVPASPLASGRRPEPAATSVPIAHRFEDPIHRWYESGAATPQPLLQREFGLHDEKSFRPLPQATFHPAHRGRPLPPQFKPPPLRRVRLVIAKISSGAVANKNPRLADFIFWLVGGAAECPITPPPSPGFWRQDLRDAGRCFNCQLGLAAGSHWLRRTAPPPPAGLAAAGQGGPLGCCRQKRPECCVSVGFGTHRLSSGGWGICKCCSVAGGHALPSHCLSGPRSLQDFGEKQSQSVTCLLALVFWIPFCSFPIFFK